MSRKPRQRRRGSLARNSIGTVLRPGTFRLERLLPGPIERVWSYLIDPAKRRLWFADGPLDLRPGGALQLQFRFAELTPEPLPPGRDAECTLIGVVTRCEPPRLLSYTWGLGPSASQVTFELTPRGAEVLLVVTHSELADTQDMIRVASGWHAHLAILIEALGGRRASPFWQMKRLAEETCREMLNARA
jgi:uncharacterized protein YndB with AHSA1/START domain